MNEKEQYSINTKKNNFRRESFKMMKKVFIVFSILLSNCSFSQVEYIKIKPEIVGQNYSDDLLYMKTSLENLSNEQMNFWTMTCSWNLNWITDSDSLKLDFHECDSNYPVLISLNPGEQIDFYMTIKSLNSIYRNRNTEFRLGFVLVKESEYNYGDFETDLYDIVPTKKKQNDIIWSEKIKVDFVGKQYRLRK